MDEVEKSKLNEVVHAFLLVLCTSHKFRVIFIMGASLCRIKICTACPNLRKTV